MNVSKEYLEEVKAATNNEKQALTIEEEILKEWKNKYFEIFSK